MAHASGGPARDPRQGRREVTPGPIAFSHTTSLILQGVDVWDADLSRIHVTRLDEGAARRQRDVVHHVGSV